MATRSRIAIYDCRKHYRSIYCHWDGYPGHNGKILLEHYQDPNKVNQLIELGDLSILGPEIGEKHDFNAHSSNIAYKKMCLAFGRDRGERNVEFKSHVSTKNIPREQWLYLFRNGKWYYENSYESSERFKLLTKKVCDKNG
ncbi:MAG: hypothetical protein RL621_1855 [Bacteroidota bacterium]|jgi:hypothetical protein